MAPKKVKTDVRVKQGHAHLKARSGNINAAVNRALGNASGMQSNQAKHK